MLLDNNLSRPDLVLDVDIGLLRSHFLLRFPYNKYCSWMLRINPDYNHIWRTNANVGDTFGNHKTIYNSYGSYTGVCKQTNHPPTGNKPELIPHDIQIDQVILPLPSYLSPSLQTNHPYT